MTSRWGIAAAIVLVLLLAGCSGDDDGTRVTSGASTTVSPSTTSQGGLGTPSKVSGNISALVAEIDRARAAGSDDVSSLSNALVHVRADGSIELVVRAAAPIVPSQEADLQALGAEIEGKLDDASRQAWVPHDKVDAVAALPWVSAVTAPSYSRTGG